MRIAVHHNLPSGGAKRALFDWISRLVKDHIVDLYRLESSPEDFLDVSALAHKVVSMRVNLPVSTDSYSIVGKAILYRRLRQVSEEMAHTINTSGYDLAFVHQCRFVQCPMLLRYLTVPSLFFCQEPNRRFYEPPVEPLRTRSEKLRQTLGQVSNAFLKRVDAMNARSAGMILANSQYSREAIYRAYGVWPRTNYLGVDVDRFHPQPVPRDGFVLSVGALYPKKSHSFLIAAVGRLPASIRPELVIAFDRGDAESERRLRVQAADQGVRLRVTTVAGEEMAVLYSRARITMFAAVLEPLGLVPLESMACGTPVVGVREAGIRETVVDGLVGLLTERDPDDFASAVERLLTDEPLWQRLSRNGPDYVRARWSIEQSTANLLKHMQLLVETQRTVS